MWPGLSFRKVNELFCETLSLGNFFLTFPILEPTDFPYLCVHCLRAFCLICLSWKSNPGIWSSLEAAHQMLSSLPSTLLCPALPIFNKHPNLQFLHQSHSLRVCLGFLVWRASFYICVYSTDKGKFSFLQGNFLEQLPKDHQILSGSIHQYVHTHLS